MNQPDQPSHNSARYLIIGVTVALLIVCGTVITCQNTNTPTAIWVFFAPIIGTTLNYLLKTPQK